MAIERTLAIVKPNAVAKGHTGKVVSRIEAEGLKIRALKLVHLTKKQAEGFYDVHRQRPFFNDLTDFMSRGPVVAMILEGENAISAWRGIMGATDPAKAEPGTLRAEIGDSLTENSVHGSDATDTAATETAYFFDALEIV